MGRPKVSLYTFATGASAIQTKLALPKDILNAGDNSGIYGPIACRRFRRVGNSEG